MGARLWYTDIAMGAKNWTLSVFPSELRRIIRSKSRSARSRGERFEMSGARATSPVASPPANGPAAGGVATVRAPENRWPARSAMTASIAMAATAQGRADVADAVSRVLLAGAVRDPTAVPHRWQNRAPGESRERHPEQIASATAAPHSEQKRPVVGAPQLGQ